MSQKYCINYYYKSSSGASKLSKLDQKSISLLIVFQAILALLLLITSIKSTLQGLPWWSSGKESTLQSKDAGSIPGQGTKIPHAPGQLSLRATTTELPHLNQSPCATNYRVHGLWNPCATTREKPAHHKAPQGKIPHASTKIPHAATKTQHSQK